MRKSFATLLLSGVVLMGTFACGAPEEEQGQTPDTFKYVFTGELQATTKKFNVVVNCNEDGTFQLVVKDADKTFDGTYTFADGIGFTFKFKDTNKTQVSTKFDAETKEHYFDYEIKLGEEGKGVVRLKLKDETFVPTISSDEKINFLRRANFKGDLIGTPADPSKPETTPIFSNTLSITEDGKCKLEFDAKLSMAAVEGTYKFANNTFEFTLGGKTYKTKYNLGKAEYSFTYPVKYEGSDKNITFTWNSTQKGLTGFNEMAGGVTMDLYIYGDKTALFDATLKAAPIPAMNSMFDRKATWEFDPKTSQYTFTLPAASEGAEPTKFTTTYNKETGESSFTYTMQSEFGPMPFEMKGVMNDYFSLTSIVDTQFGKCTFEFNFLDDTKVLRDVYGAGPAATMFDGEGTYTFTNNEIKVKFKESGDKEFASTWNEEDGTYTINYVLQGPELKLEPVLVGAIW